MSPSGARAATLRRRSSFKIGFIGRVAPAGFETYPARSTSPPDRRRSSVTRDPGSLRHTGPDEALEPRVLFALGLVQRAAHGRDLAFQARRQPLLERVERSRGLRERAPQPPDPRLAAGRVQGVELVGPLPMLGDPRYPPVADRLLRDNTSRSGGTRRGRPRQKRPGPAQPARFGVCAGQRKVRASGPPSRMRVGCRFD